MISTFLSEKFSTSGARMGRYSGVETVLAFSDIRTEFDALRNGCGLCDLGWCSRIVVTGKDRTRWLNGMVTNNIKDLPVGSGNYNFLLNPQGRILGDLYTYNRGEYFLLVTDHDQAENLKNTLNRYIIMDDVELTDVSADLTAFGILGPESAQVLGQVGFGAPETLEPMQVEDILWGKIGLSITRMAIDNSVAYELWFHPANSEKIWDALVVAGAVPVGTEALETLRIAMGIPKYGQDIRERDLPQETGQNRALNFSKGCYIGQEIVERIRSRGNVHRKFIGFMVEGPTPSFGAKLHLDGKEVGEITSARAVPSAGGERVLAIGYIRREASALGTVVQCNGSRATVTDLPFVEANSG